MKVSQFIRQFDLFSRDLFCLRQCWFFCLQSCCSLNISDMEWYPRAFEHLMDGKCSGVYSLAVFKINILQNKSKDFRTVRVLSAGSLLSKGCFHAHVSPSSEKNSFLTPSFRVYGRTCQWYNIYWSVKHISKTPATSIFKTLRRRVSLRKMEKGQLESFINLNIPEESRDVYASSSRTPPPS